jgi:hypothetical protein
MNTDVVLKPSEAECHRGCIGFLPRDHYSLLAPGIDPKRRIEQRLLFVACVAERGLYAHFVQGHSESTSFAVCTLIQTCQPEEAWGRD